MFKKIWSILRSIRAETKLKKFISFITGACCCSEVGEKLNYHGNIKVTNAIHTSTRQNPYPFSLLVFRRTRLSWVRDPKAVSYIQSILTQIFASSTQADPPRRVRPNIRIPKYIYDPYSMLNHNTFHEMHRYLWARLSMSRITLSLLIFECWCKYCGDDVKESGMRPRRNNLREAQKLSTQQTNRGRLEHCCNSDISFLTQF